ncbi:MAG: class I SAM-dependent DNA methyltransferase [Acutalibacteraceae bacterium]
MSYTSFASVYDALTKNVDYKKRAQYIMDILAEYNIKDGLLLDLACGTGSLSVEFSKAGFDVIGTDASSDMLTQAQTKAFENGQNILFLCQNMEETDLYGTVRAVVCSLDSINHLKDIETVEKTFSRLKNFTDNGGIMIFDVNTPYKHQKILGNNTFIYDEKSVYCVWQNRLSEDNVTVNINLDFFVKSNGAYQRFTENFSERAYTSDELENAFERNGFKLVADYEEFTRNKPTDTAERVYYVLRREH